MLMDFYCMEACIALPEFQVINQVIRPQQLDIHLERRECTLVCPHCATSCSRVKESRPRCMRDFPVLEHPVMLWLHMRRFACPPCRHRPWETSETFGERTKWTQRLYDQVREECLRGCPGTALARRYGLAARTVLRWTFAKSRGGRPRKLGRAIGIDAYARHKGPRSHTLLVDLEKGQPIATVKGRRAAEVMAWFTSRPHDERDQVAVGVWDMSKTYQQFPVKSQRHMCWTTGTGKRCPCHYV